MRTFHRHTLRLDRILMCLLYLGLLCGCTHNNGDIGVWFGTWALTSVTVDGEPGAEYANNSTWSFQNRVIKIQVEYEHSNYHDHYGTWSQEGDNFTLDYTHTDQNEPEWSFMYKFPEHMYFGMRQGVAEMHVEHLSGKNADLKYVNPEGQTVVYHLKKLY